VAAVHQEVQRALQAEAAVSLKVLKAIRDDIAAPVRTRADIGLKLMAMAGFGREIHKTGDDKPLNEMTQAELLAYMQRNQAEVDKLEAELASRAKDVSSPSGAKPKAKPQTFLD
jgi:hypothetical protein